MVIIVICVSHIAKAQVSDSLVSDSTKLIYKPIALDSLNNQNSKADDHISNDAIKDKVLYNARDSTVIDHLDKKMYLYGDAFVEFNTMELKAGKIIIDFDKNEAIAFPGVDSVGREEHKPFFKDGENEFTCDKLRYNFNSKKGMVYKAVTTQSDLYVHGAKTKFVSKDTDSLLTDDIVYTQNAIVTSCNADDPHFGIMAKKLKVIPGKLAVVGPSWLKIMDVPLVPLPFGFFPMNKGKSTGLIFPKGYESDTRSGGKGYGLKGVGWYFPVNDKLDVQLTGDIYSRGDWGARAKVRYDVRYKYSGSVNLNYTTSYSDDSEGNRINKPSYAIVVSHNQDSKAHPYRTIGGSINISTRGDHQRNNHSAAINFKTNYSSRFGLNYKLPNTPWSFSMDMTHNQNTIDKSVNINFPLAKANLKTIYPFKSNAPGKNKESWYEKISFSYNAELKNVINATDSTLFDQETFNNMQNGIQQKFKTGASFNLLKYFSFNVDANWQEYWTLKTLNRSLLDTLITELDTTTNEIDTLKFGLIVDDFNSGFKAQHNYGVSAGLSTKIFSTYQKKKGFFRGIRYVATPRIGISYNPDTKAFYEESYYNDLRIEERDLITYSPFEKAAYKTGLRSQGLNITYGVGNLFETKFFTEKDSSYKKIKLLNSLNLSGSYNLAADSMNWSKVSLSGNSRLFWGWTNMTISGKFDPYIQRDGKSVNELVWKDGFKLPELDHISFSFSTSFKMSKLFDLFSRNKDKNSQNTTGGTKKTQNSNTNKNFKAAPSKITDLIKNFTLGHYLKFQYDRVNDSDTSFVSVHTIELRGKIQVSENWSINIGNIGYDFLRNRVTYPDLGFSRKLHCWNMSFSWVPNRESFSFLIGVNSKTLGFLKTNYGTNQSRGGIY